MGYCRWILGGGLLTIAEHHKICVKCTHEEALPNMLMKFHGCSFVCHYCPGTCSDKKSDSCTSIMLYHAKMFGFGNLWMSPRRRTHTNCLVWRRSLHGTWTVQVGDKHGWFGPIGAHILAHTNVGIFPCSSANVLQCTPCGIPRRSCLRGASMARAIFGTFPCCLAEMDL